MSTIGEKVIILIPTYNEAAGIEALIDELLAQNEDWEILVVDDDSPDGTAEIVDRLGKDGRRLHLLRREGRPRSFGKSLLEGIDWCRRSGYGLCVHMDADRSHAPAEVGKLIAACGDGCEAAIGSRYLGGTRVRNWPFWRLCLSRGAGSLVRRLLRVPLSDPTSGFRAYRLELLERIDIAGIRSDGYAFSFELNAALSRTGAMKEVPITFSERRNGKSKLSPAMIIEAATRMIQLGMSRKKLQQDPGA